MAGKVCLQAPSPPPVASQASLDLAVDGHDQSYYHRSNKTAPVRVGVASGCG